jgi:hypothetical protein
MDMMLDVWRADQGHHAQISLHRAINVTHQTMQHGVALFR